MQGVDDRMQAAYDRMQAACNLHASLVWPRLNATQATRCFTQGTHMQEVANDMAGICHVIWLALN